MKSRTLRCMIFLSLGLILGLSLFSGDQSRQGYYRYPALHGDTLVFAAEGDLWTVGSAGGLRDCQGSRNASRIAPSSANPPTIWEAFSARSYAVVSGGEATANPAMGQRSSPCRGR